MWNYNKENLYKSTDGASYVNKSGCYICTIERAYIYTADNSNSEAVNIELTTNNDEKIRLNLFYKNKKGEAIEFNEIHLNHLEHLTKSIHDQLVNSIAYELINKLQRPVIKGLTNKKIGVVVEVEAGEKNYNYILKSFFEVEKNRTSEEIMNQVEPTTISKYMKKYENAQEVKLNKEENKTNISDDDKDILNSFAKDMAESEDFPF